MRLPGVRRSSRHRKRLCVSALRSPELSAQLDGQTLLRLIDKSMVKEYPYRRSRNPMWCVEDGGRGVCSSDVHHLVLFAYDSISVSSAWELTSVSMRYSQGDGVNTSLSRLMYCTHD